MNRELPDIMPHPLNVVWDCFGMADLCWPPPAQRGRQAQIKQTHTTIGSGTLKQNVVVVSYKILFSVDNHISM